jgi:hypothetical protein
LDLDAKDGWLHGLAKASAAPTKRGCCASVEKVEYAAASWHDDGDDYDGGDDDGSGCIGLKPLMQTVEVGLEVAIGGRSTSFADCVRARLLDEEMKRRMAGRVGF